MEMVLFLALLATAEVVFMQAYQEDIDERKRPEQNLDAIKVGPRGSGVTQREANRSRDILSKAIDQHRSSTLLLNTFGLPSIKRLFENPHRRAGIEVSMESLSAMRRKLVVRPGTLVAFHASPRLRQTDTVSDCQTTSTGVQEAEAP